MRAALLQLRTPDTHAGALAHVLPLIREAAAQGARLVLTPEGTNILERNRARLTAQLKPVGTDPVVLALQTLAAELSIEIVIGSAFIARAEGGYANRSLHVGADGMIIAGYDKMHMFDVDLPGGDVWRESETFEAGDRLCVSQSVIGKLGLTICYDLRFPNLFRRLSQSGAEIILVPAAFTRTTGEAHWEVLLRARAIETGSFILAAAQGGDHADGRATWGRSMAVCPWGRVIARSVTDEPGALLVDLGLDEVIRAREAVPAFGV